MIRPETIERAIDAVIAQCSPEQVFVIGSYATRTAKRTSDLDLLIVAESTEAKRRRDERVEQVLAPLMIPVDINVYTPREFARELAQPFSFARTATELQGQLVYSRTLGDFTELQRCWDGEASAERHARLQRAPGEWQLYQAQYARVARARVEPAWAFAAETVRSAAGARVADLGCGECALAAAVGRELASVDHRAADRRAIAGDLAALPLGDRSMDVAVLSLALVGTNWTDAIAEATRIVAPGGRVLVTELAAGRRSPEAVIAALASHGCVNARAHDRGPFVDIEVVRAG